jgi:hypothetical protein
MTMMTMGDGLDVWMDILVAESGEVGLGEIEGARRGRKGTRKELHMHITNSFV